MSRGKRYQPEQVVNLLRQIEVGVANGKTAVALYLARRPRFVCFQQLVCCA